MKDAYIDQQAFESTAEAAKKVAYIDGQPFEIEAGETMLAFIRRYKEKHLYPRV